MVLKAWLYEAWCIGAVLFWITVSSYRQLSDEALEKIAAMSTQVNEFSVSGDLLSPLLVPRVAGTPENERVRDYIINYFKDLDWDVELDSFTDETPFGPKHFSNIIVTKDTNATDHLVLAAHFDSKYYENFEFIGATDSAVPCAILMSLAKHLDPILTMHPGDTTLQLIFFDGEEAFVKWSDTDSTYGARHLAKKWSQTPYQSRVSKTVKSQTMLDRIEVLVLLDLLGTPNPRIPNYYRSTSGLFDAIADLEQRLFSLSLLETKSMKTESDLRPIFDPYSAMNFKGNLVSDDHLPFRQRGVKILHIIPAPFPYVWHNQQDNADCIDVAQVRNLAILFQAFVLEYLDLEP